jgi:hypothetical protein
LPDICENEFLVKLSVERAGSGFVLAFDFDVTQVSFTKLHRLVARVTLFYFRVRRSRQVYVHSRYCLF